MPNDTGADTSFQVRIATDMGWIRGALSLPPGRALLETLNAHQGLLYLRGVTVPGSRERLDTFAVRVASISLVLPAEAAGDPLARTPVTRSRLAAPPRPRRVVLAFERFQVSGTADLAGRSRLTEAFSSGRSFVRLDGAILEPRRTGEATERVETLPEVYVNVARTHGFAEFDDEAPQLAPNIVGAHPDTLAALGLPVVPNAALHGGAADARSAGAQARTSGGFSPPLLRPGLEGPPQGGVGRPGGARR